MIIRRTAIAAIAGLAAAGLWAAVPAAAAEYEIDVSLETGPNHVRNITVKQWAETVGERSGGRLKINVFDAASRFKGAAVPTALAQGTLDMGIPGTWHLTKIEPLFGAPFLPAFFGRDRHVSYAVMDGEIGRELTDNIEQKLHVKVLGRFIDIGDAITFTKSAPIETPEDYRDKRLRVAGSAAHSRRYEAFGANAVKISWPDVPQALQTGMVDGVMTAFESVRSAKLWDSGLKYAYVDHLAFHQYVPMVNGKVWKDLPEDLQQVMIETWEEFVDAQREYTAQRDMEARQEAIENGILVVEATPAHFETLRGKLEPVEAEFIAALRIDPEFAGRVKRAVQAAVAE